MKKNLLLSCLATGLLLTIATSCQHNQKDAISINPPTQASKHWENSEIDAFIIKKIKEQNAVFDWAQATDEMIWSATSNTDNMIAIGYEEGKKAEIVKIIVENEQKATPSVDYSKFEAGTDFDNLNAMYAKIKSFETIQKLRQSGLIRYIYPSGYSVEDHQLSLRSDSGCDGYVGETLVAGTDYTLISPSAKQSWSYSYSQIPQAWVRARGAGIGVMVIDAGLSSSQSIYQLSNFINGTSIDTRSIELLCRYPAQLNFWGTSVTSYETSPYSACGHGTAMTGIISAPRNTLGANVGVAYDCNLISVRAVEDVVISNSKEELGVAAALNLAATKSNVKIVSMSLGSITTRSVIGDAIKNIRNNGKLPFCAAGTSFSWLSWYGVIYPASMPEAIAVTGVESNGAICDVCHTGSEVDFIAVMDRSSDNKKILSLAMSGYQPTTVGGSSAATASVAGMAALVWSKNTAQTSTTVLNRLSQNGSYYPSKNTTYGWGIINVNNATNF